jgi:hypothetical protein
MAHDYLDVVGLFDRLQDGWQAIERHLDPGRELKAKYAFDDVWKAGHGPA